MRERTKHSFHFSAIRSNNLKSKFFNNNLKKNLKKSYNPVSAIKERRKSVEINKSEHKHIISNFTSSKPAKKNLNVENYEYLLFGIKYAYQMLRKKYNCSHIAKLYRKEEVRSIYDMNQIQYLIEKRKSRIFSRLKEILIINNNNEYLLNDYKTKESKIILKYLLFFVYDKDKFTINERISEKTNKDKLKSLFERKILINNKRYMQYNNKNEEKEESRHSFYESKKRNKQNIIKNYKFIYDISPLDIKNSIPNLYPNETRILIDIKQFSKKKLYQKLIHQKYYYKDISANYETNKYNKSSKDDKNSKSKIINKSFSKYFFRKKNNPVSNHNNDRRIKNDVDIFDLEKLIKIIDRKDKKLKENNTAFNNKTNFEKTIFAQKMNKKVIFNYSSIINNEKSIDKNQISQNSTTLSLLNRDNMKSSNFKKRSVIAPNKLSKKIHSPKFVNMHYKKLFHNSSEKNLENSISIIQEKGKKYDQLPVKNNYLRKMLFNNESKNENQMTRSFNKFGNNETNLQNLKCNYISLRDFLKFDNETKYSYTKKSVKILKPAKSFEYKNEFYIFTKKQNENVWEKGADVSSQIQGEDIKKRVLTKLKLLNRKSLNSMRKKYTLRKMANFGDVYYKDFSIS